MGDPKPVELYKIKPEANPIHRLMYGRYTDSNGIDFDVTVVRYDQFDGTKGYLQLLGPTKSWGSQYSDVIKMIGAFPIFENKRYNLEDNDPEAQKLMMEWIKTQKVPTELKYKLLDENVDPHN